MPTEEKTLEKYIYDKLVEAGWPDLEINDAGKSVTCPKGKIIYLQGGDYILQFYYYSQDDSEYKRDERSAQIQFPTDFDFRSYLYFRSSGSYSLSYGSLFKKIINPLGKVLTKIKITNDGEIARFYKSTLTIPKNIFISVIGDARRTYTTSDSYRKSTQNYLANQYSRNYSTRVRQRTTYLQKGEFKFLVDRYYLKTKKNKKQFLQFLNNEDVSSLEELFTLLLKNDVFSPDFMRFLDDYFIREKLQEIISIGRQILELKTEKTDTVMAQKVIKLIGDEPIRQFETIWQRYFEKYLLYLIFTYKKIFPKVELENISGEKKHPDFIGINHYNGLDIIEIKTHLKNILVWDSSHKNFYFSPEMSKAIVQTNNYMDAIVQRRFQSNEDERKITKFIDEENLYHPRGIIIISSTSKITNKEGKDTELRRDFTKLRNSLHNIEILTFDEVLGIADEYIKNITPEASTS